MRNLPQLKIPTLKPFRGNSATLLPPLLTYPLYASIILNRLKNYTDLIQICALKHNQCHPLKPTSLSDFPFTTLIHQRALPIQPTLSTAHAHSGRVCNLVIIALGFKVSASVSSLSGESGTCKTAFDLPSGQTQTHTHFIFTVLSSCPLTSTGLFIPSRKPPPPQMTYGHFSV